MRRFVIQRDGRAPLRDAGQSIGVVPCVRHLRLPRHLHRTAPFGVVIGIICRSLRRHLLGQAIDAVVLSRDGAGEGVDCLGQSVAAVEGIIDRARIAATVPAKAGEGPSVERIVLVFADVAVTVGIGDQIAVSVIRVTVVLEQRVGARRPAITQRLY